VAHVCIQRFSASDDEDDGTEYGESMPSVLDEEVDRVTRIERPQHLRCLDDPPEAKDGDREEPHHHHGTKESSDTVSAMTLNQEQTDQDDNRDRYDPGTENGRRDLESLDRAHDAHRRRDHPLATEQ
jgi:hypothetical protein